MFGCEGMLLVFFKDCVQTSILNATIAFLEVCVDTHFMMINAKGHPTGFRVSAIMCG